MTRQRWLYVAVLSSIAAVASIVHHAAAAQEASKQAQAGTTAVFPDALTFAQVQEGDRLSTILVLDIQEGRVHGIDLSRITRHYARDVFDVVSGLTWARVEQIARDRKNVASFPITQLVGVGPRGLAHIAAGTNYPEHGKETGMDQGTFLFPKFSPATGPAGEIDTGPGVLLDYEAEVCARFDRELRTALDFDAARKGFFLCGDSSDRATLVREINLKDPYSGDGFPDAKSGSGRFPTGPFLVVPRDWQAFVAKVAFKTIVNGQLRQDVQAADMVKDLRAIVAEALADGATRTWSHATGRVPMLRRAAVGTETAVLTGTGDGVVFQAPSAALIEELMAADDRRQQLRIIDRYVQEEDAKRIYLQAGDTVRHDSNYLGWIDTRVVATGVDAGP